VDTCLVCLVSDISRFSCGGETVVAVLGSWTRGNFLFYPVDIFSPLDNIATRRIESLRNK